MENKLTAVEWLVSQVEMISNKKVSKKEAINLYNDAVTQAKAIEQDSIIQAYSNGWHDGQDLILNQVIHIDAGGDKAGEQYFNDTFKTEDNGE